jgi:L-histidine Nalpha-methyltransferase / hercynylcysteine S-oxide synthase
MKILRVSPTSMLSHSLFCAHQLINRSRFILNSLAHANRLFKRDIFNLEDWRVIGEYVYDNHEQGGRHQAFLSPLRDVNVLGQRIRRGERIKIEQSLKYASNSTQKLWALAGLEETERWTYNDEHGRSRPPLLASRG